MSALSASMASGIEADAVIVTRMLDVQYSIEFEEERRMAVRRRRDNVPLADFFRYDYVEIPDPVSLTTVRTVVVASDLYRASDQARLWSVESIAFEKNHVAEVLDRLSRLVTRTLRRDSLVC